MLTVLGGSKTCCDGVSRRAILRAGALAFFGGMHTPPLAGAASTRKGRIKSVILLDLYGGPSHIDTFDPKPDAPAEIRGEFRAISTSVPGLKICEHMPLLSRRMHQTCLIRTLSHGYNSHNPYAVMTGYTGGSDQVDYFAKPTNHPSMGSVCQYFGVGTGSKVPSYVCLPAMPGYSQGLRRAGPYGGYLGARYDPLFAVCDPKWPRLVEEKDFYDPKQVAQGDPRLPTLCPELTVDALSRRRSLLGQLDARAAQLDQSGGAGLMSRRQREAFDLLLAPAARHAFDLEREAPAVRDRYGRDLFGSSVLLARRLVEAGVTFVTVHTESKGPGHWDTHDNNFNLLKVALLPFLDRALSALLDDLHDRGLIESTLVMVMGDMGRTPKVNARAGRDHWPQCGFALLAGGPVKPGLAYGRSDRVGAFPADFPVSPGDLVATTYHLLGVDPEETVPDHTGRPTHISHGGQALREILT